MKKNLIINAGLVLALAFLASIIFMSHWYMSQVVVSDQREEYAFNVIQELDKLLYALREANRNQREFVITGETQYLTSHNKALDEMERELTTLMSLTNEQPLLFEQLTKIETLVRHNLGERNRIDVNRSGKVPADAAASNRASITEIRKQVSAVKDEMIRVIRSSSSRQNKDFRKVQRLVEVMSIIIFALVSMIFLLLRRDIARRIKSEQELVRHRDRLDELVKIRTQELVTVNQQLLMEIDEHNRTDSLLQDAHRRLLDTLESMTDGFVSLDRQWRYTYVNTAAARYLGKTGAELLGRVCWEAFPGSEQSHACSEIRRSKAENCFVHFEDFNPAPPVRWFENRCYPSSEGLTVYFTDITERKWAEQIHRNWSEHEDTIQEQERLALSREVHDEIGQNLTALTLDLSWIEYRYPPGNGELAERLAEMRTTLGHLIGKAQRITAKLRPPLLDNLGLAAAIEWQAREFRRRSGTECLVMLNEGIEADEHTSTTIIRIFQESLTNVIRHARATEVSISLCERDGTIILEISDNGCGIKIEEIGSPTAFGIMGMRERAQLCKGDLAITGKPGEGTIVRLAIPRHAGKETS